MPHRQWPHNLPDLNFHQGDTNPICLKLTLFLPFNSHTKTNILVSFYGYEISYWSYAIYHFFLCGNWYDSSGSKLSCCPLSGEIWRLPQCSRTSLYHASPRNLSSEHTAVPDAASLPLIITPKGGTSMYNSQHTIHTHPSKKQIGKYSAVKCVNFNLQLTYSLDNVHNISICIKLVFIAWFWKCKNQVWVEPNMWWAGITPIWLLLPQHWSPGGKKQII